MRDLSIEVTRVVSEDVSEEPPKLQGDVAIDRRSFMRGAAVVGAAVVGSTVLVPSAEAAKHCFPSPAKKPSVVGFTAEAETGLGFQGRMDLDSVEAITLPGSVGDALSVELFFDTYEERVSVKPTMDGFASLATVDLDLHRPPVVLFTWGTGTKRSSFRGVIESASVVYTGFLEDGTPVGGLAVTHIQILEACAL